MNNTYFASKKLKGRDVSAAPLMDKHNKSVNIKEEQNGRSMIEMLGVLAIIGVLSVGGIAGYSKAMMKYRVNKTIEQITLIAGNIRTFFGTQKDYKDLNIAVIKKAKLVPDEMWNEAKTGLVNVFGGSVTIGWMMGVCIFEYTSISQEACIELATKDWTSVAPYGLAITNSAFHATQKINDKGCSAGYMDGHGPYAYVSCEATISLDAATKYCQDNKNFAVFFKK